MASVALVPMTSAPARIIAAASGLLDGDHGGGHQIGRGAAFSLLIFRRPIPTIAGVLGGAIGSANDGHGPIGA